MDAAHELLKNLAKEIAEDVERTRHDMDGIRARYLDHETERQRLNEAWHNHGLRVAPLRKARDQAIQQLANLEAMKPPGPIFIPKP